MFGHGVFGRKGKPVRRGCPDDPVHMREDEDPLSGVEEDLAADEAGMSGFKGAVQAVLAHLTDSYDDGDDRKYDNILSALGASAGFGCQMALREGLIMKGHGSEEQMFVTVDTIGGCRFFTGDALNSLLFDTGPGVVSIYQLVGSAVQAAGGQGLPDVEDLVKHAAGTIGGDDFGVPRLPAIHMPTELPLQSLKRHWATLDAILKSHNIDPGWLGWAYAHAVQNVILERKDLLSPYLAAKIVLEAAVPMSRMDPARILKP